MVGNVLGPQPLPYLAYSVQEKEFWAALSVGIIDDVLYVRLTRIPPSGLAKILFLNAI